MKTVPTLCATSTIGAAAVGLSFGIPESSPVPEHAFKKRRATTYHDTNEITHPFPDARRTPSSRRIQTPTEIPSTTPNFAQSRLGSFTRARRATSAGLEDSTRSSTITYHDVPTVAENEPSVFDPRASIASRSSWVRRLSSFHSSHSASPSSSIRPETPSIFSNGSAAPILRDGERQSTLPPNKLVKRSSSQLGQNGGLFSFTGSRPQGPTLRRPATSHQRSATLKHHHAFAEERDQHALIEEWASQSRIPSQEVVSLQPSKGWRMCFRPKTVKTSQTPAGNAIELKVMKRIHPDSQHPPTLLLADDIAPADAKDDSLSIDGDSIFLGSSRPVTPAAINAILSVASDGPSQAEDKGSGRRPRHSFSVSDMLSSKSSSPDLSRSQSFRTTMKGRLGSSKGLRISSAPFTTPHEHPGDQPRRVDSSLGFKRPDITDPSIFQESVTIPCNSHASTEETTVPVRPRNVSAPLPSSNQESEPIDVHALPPTSNAGSHRLSQSASFTGPSSPPVHSYRPCRTSVGPSDRASTLVGSDNEMTFNSGDEDDVDFQSDTVFDSLRTVTTGASSSGPRGPRIDTIFDESPPQLPTKGSLIDLQDLLRDGLFPDHAITAVDKSACIEEDNGSLSTPVQSSKCSEDDLSTPIRAKVPGPTIDGLSTFQGKFLKSNLDSPYFDGDAEAEGFDGWSFDRDYDSPIKSPIKYSGSSDARNSLSLPQSPHANLSGMNHESPNDSSQTLSIEHTDKDARSSLFDWSEQQPIRKDSPTGSSARPNTVHGKQGTDVRGSRASGRRGPSAAHVRSQSVPVVPESGNKRDPSGGANRFGTWGNSSKVPTEDWDDDFEFDDSNALEKKGGKDGDDTRVDSGVAMIVPKAIQEQQANVLGHLGHVREFALLVEDLKRLRIRATAKGILNGPSESLWTEAEGIINLATLDDDEQELSPPHSPSSADFNFDPFEDDATPAQPVRFQRKSVLSPDDDIFGEGKAKSHYYANPASKLDKTQASPSGRNRKDSTAMAKSVLANMYQRRDGSNQLMSANKSQPQHKRMYFDTTTLRDLVAHVNVLARNLSEIVRSVDSVPSSPDFGPNRPDTPFPDLFVDIPLDSSNGKENSPNSKDGTGTIIALQGNGRGLHGRMDRMVVL